MASAEPELEAAPASLKSAVWRYFAFPVSYVDSVHVVHKNTTLCKMCNTRVPYPATRNILKMIIYFVMLHVAATKKGH